MGKGLDQRSQLVGVIVIIVNVDKNQDFVAYNFRTSSSINYLKYFFTPFPFLGFDPGVVHRGKTSEQRVTSGTV